MTPRKIFNARQQSPLSPPKRRRFRAHDIPIAANRRTFEGARHDVAMMSS